MMMGLVQLSVPSAAAWIIPLHPPASSTIAQSVDQLYFALTGISVFFTVLIFATIFYFMVKYRRRDEEEVPPATKDNLPLELAWTIIPSLICLGLFFWASMLYVHNSRPPKSSMEIFVVGKQWMWHLQHSEGVREIDELHVPVGEPVKLTITSEDVIHDFYIPAFRVKKDAVPGRYSSIWFQATKTGTYHFYCAQYCGTNHSEMLGWVYVMSPSDYTAWLEASENTESMAQQGARLFDQFSCGSCHLADGTGRGPSLAGVFGKTRQLQNGQSRLVDDAYIRQTIVNPNSILLPNYPPVMPTYQGQISEEQVLELIAYVKSLGPEERTPQGK